MIARMSLTFGVSLLAILLSQEASGVSLRASSLARAVPGTLAAGIAEAESRDRCHDVIHAYETEEANPGHYVHTLQSIMTGLLSKTHENIDKDIEYALKTLGWEVQHSRNIDLVTLDALTKCAVDDVSASWITRLRTFTVAATFLTPDGEEVLTLVDKKGNNILHLAVLSQDSGTVTDGLSMLDDIFATETLKTLFDATNAEGKTPLNLSEQRGMPPTIKATLQAYYRTHYFGTAARTLKALPREAPAAPAVALPSAISSGRLVAAAA